MFKSYFIIAWRNLLKSKAHAFINIGGLAAGLAACLLIGLYISDELSYDRFNKNADRIHRLVTADWPKMPPAAAPELMASYPHLVEQAVRFWPVFAPAKMRYKDVVFVESGIVFADPNAFNVFTWPFVAGNPSSALTRSNSVVLTRSSAVRYFGTKDPLGEQMKFWGNDLTVTGVIEDIPHNAHMRFDFLVSFSTLQMVMGNGIDAKWDVPAFYTYVLSRSGTTTEQLQAAVKQLFKTNVNDSTIALTTQPLTSIHLNSNLKGEFAPGGNASYIYILGTAALFILILAGVNFTNLNTARAVTRVKELGMRKTLGALKRNLIEQFFGESLLTSLIALLLAIIVVTSFIPAFNQVAGKAIQMNALLSARILGGAGIIVLLISFFAGAYPALFLSRLRPATALKGSGNLRASNPVIRRGLIVLQFMISTFFLSGMVIVLLQLNFIQNKDLGYDQEHVIVLDGDGFPLFKKALQGVAGVGEVSGVPRVIPGLLPSSPYRAQGVVTDSASRMTYSGVTPGFIETMNIKMIAGNTFKEGSEKDDQEAFVLNESAVRELGWTPDEAIGRAFSMWVPPIDGGNEVWRDGYITGVVSNFNHDALYEKVHPLVLYPSRDMNLTLVRIQNNPNVIASIQKVWKNVNPDAPFNYYFLSDRIRQQYESEMRLGALVTGATGLAVIIACLGLAGLVSFSANQRTKEVGIRKTMGATGRQIVALLSAEFAWLVGLAAVLSLPIAYFALSKWVSNFAYHIDMSWVIFAASGLCTFLVAMITVTFQSLKVALTRPVESLRSE